MKQPVVIIGIGEMAGVFARGFLRAGHPVFPVTRDMDMDAAAVSFPQPAMVLVAVGESDLHPTLERIPAAWRDRLGLLQNELLPRDWEAHGIANPTAIAVWFEKKPGRDFKVLVPSETHGPGAPLIKDALERIGIPVNIPADPAGMRFELVRKNVYILTTNVAGMALPAGSTVERLWSDHQALAREVADEVMAIQFWLTGSEFDREQLIQGMVTAIEGDPAHVCMGRSAPARLARALQHADQAGLEVPKLRAIQGKHG